MSLRTINTILGLGLILINAFLMASIARGLVSGEASSFLDGSGTSRIAGACLVLAVIPDLAHIPAKLMTTEPPVAADMSNFPPSCRNNAAQLSSLAPTAKRTSRRFQEPFDIWADMRLL
jgi:hypothetical protein